MEVGGGVVRVNEIRKKQLCKLKKNKSKGIKMYKMVLINIYILVIFLDNNRFDLIVKNIK